MKRFLLLPLLFITAITLNAQIINIPADYATIQEGIDASKDGDTLLVQPGIYYENINYLGKAITVGSLTLTTSDTSYISQTIINGGGNAAVVSFLNDEDIESVLLGFTITNGWCGILCESYNGPFLKDLIIKENLNYYGHTGIYRPCYGGTNMIVENCLFENNYPAASVLYICNGNSDTNDSYIIRNCIFRNNEVSSSIIMTDGPTGKIDNVLIHNNTGRGIGIINAEFYINITNSTIVSNSDIGIYILYNNVHGSTVNLRNCIVWDNGNYQVGVTTLTPMTIFNIDNSCVMNGIEGVLVQPTTQLNWGENISSNPKFVDESNYNYELSDCSQAIGFGDPEYALAFDLNGDLRPQPTGSNPDIGAYENPLGVPLTPPSITLQPTGTSQCEGGSHTMTVTAEGSPVISYQWQKDGVDIPGEESNMLILNNLTQADEANYRCLVSNSCETIISNQVYVEVLEAPEFTQHPASQTKYFGNNVLFEIVATGDDTITYQWYGPSGMIAGATTDQLYIENITTADTGNYYCTATNTCGSETSLTALLTAYEQLVADAGTDIGIALGDSTQLDGSYTGGSPNISISWSPDTLLYSTNVLDPQTVALFENTYFTLTLTDATVGYQSSDTVLVTIITSDSLNYFGPGEDTLYTYNNRAGENYVSGTNSDGDKIKAQYFYNTTKTYDLEKVLIRFGKAVKTTEEEVMIKVGVWDDTGEGNTPGSLIDYVNVPLSQIAEDVNAGQITEVVFETAVQTPRSFYVGVFLPQAEEDILAVFTNIDGQSDPNMAWTLNSDDEWISYSSDPRFYLRVSNAIFPVVKINNVGLEEFASKELNYILYPNPASDVLHIVSKRDNTAENLRVRFYNFYGQKVMSFAGNHCSLSGLDAGIYFVEIITNGKQQLSKLIIE